MYNFISTSSAKVSPINSISLEFNKDSPDFSAFCGATFSSLFFDDDSDSVLSSSVVDKKDSFCEKLEFSSVLFACECSPITEVVSENVFPLVKKDFCFYYSKIVFIYI